MMEEEAYWAAFAIDTRVTLRRIDALEAHFGNLADAWDADVDDLEAAGLPREVAISAKRRAAEIDLTAMMEELDLAGAEVLCARSERYPALLMEVFDPPPVLYVKGTLLPQDGEGIAVVGTRRSTRYGNQMCYDIASGLALAGATIVSGMAKGIDTVAHRAAIDRGGRTVAVLGSGFGHIYPSENRGLAEEIARSGCLISEHPLRAKPHANHFPLRNRVIVGLARGIVAVEAPKGSGIQRTVKWALESNREVFAVPGEIDAEMSQGTNSFIKQGAHMATSADDVLSEMEQHFPDGLNRLRESGHESLVDKVNERAPSGGPTHRSRRRSGASSRSAPSGSARRTRRQPRDDRRDASASPARPQPDLDLSGLSDHETKVAGFLSTAGNPLGVDEITRGTSLSAREVNTALTMLQVRQIATCKQGAMFAVDARVGQQLGAAK